MPIIFQDGKILFVNGQIAMDLSCCCSNVGSCCCVLDPLHTYHATISAPHCTNDLDGMVISLLIYTNYGNCYGFTGNRLATPCNGAIFRVVLEIRCNTSLAARPTANACDRYEARIGYGASTCLSDNLWHRAELGCTCDPLNVVFKLPAPVWNGAPPKSCDCCVPADDITVTLTL